MSPRKPPCKARRVMSLFRVIQKKFLWNFLAVVDALERKPLTTKIMLIVCGSLLTFSYVVVAAMFQWNELAVFVPALLVSLLFLFIWEKACRSSALQQRRADWQHRRPNQRTRSRTWP